MAVTKIHAIKSTVQSAVDYISNPDKTDGRILVSTYCCGIQTAAYDFQMANSQSESKPTNNLAFHLIQSFYPGEVSFEEAHQIGEELADRLLNGKYSYVLATHIDKEHVHNHIIFAATDNEQHKRYYDNRSTYRNIRNISDTLCKEHSLSIIEPIGIRGMSYSEWQATKNNKSVKVKLKRDIFESIRHSKDYDDFITKMKLLGYQIKGSELGECAEKYISFKPPEYQRFIRGSERSLGKGYSKEDIVMRIDKMVESRIAWIEMQKKLSLDEQNIIDTKSEKFQNNPGLQNWAEIQNLKIASSIYANIGTMSDLNDNIQLEEEEIQVRKDDIATIDKQIKSLKEQIRYFEIYNECKPFYDGYLISKNKEKYMQLNESKLILYDGAKGFLERSGINPEKTTIEKLKNELNDIQGQREEAKKSQLSIKEKLDLHKKQQANIEKYLGVNKDNTLDSKNKEHKRGR